LVLQRTLPDRNQYEEGIEFKTQYIRRFITSDKETYKGNDKLRMLKSGYIQYMKFRAAKMKSEN